MDRFKYVLEAIMPIEAVQTSPGTAVGREVELLCRTPSPRWTDWYDRLGEVVLNAVQSLGVSRVAINLDTSQILHPMIARSIAAMGQLPIDIEWTEVVSDPQFVEQAARHLTTWRDRYGFRISIDDVGMGQDGYWRAVLTDARRVKIAGPAFQQWRQSARANSMIQRLIGLYRHSGAEVIVEWTETVEDVAQAALMGATHTQGRIWRSYEISGII